MDQNKPRRPQSYISSLGLTQMHSRNPWLVAFFSFSFPGFGYLLQDRYLKGFTLIIWEFFINTHAKINLGIMYSLIGRFDKAKDILDERWLILYIGIYMYAIWDGYRSTVDINNQYILADRENAPIVNMKYSAWDYNYLDKRKPWVALCWAVLVPGLGHLYNHKVISGFFLFGATIVLMYFSHLPLSIEYTMLGDFSKAKDALNMQWTLYLPSIYAFMFFHSYVTTIEQNKLFEKEQTYYLKTHYQNPDFDMPV